MADKKKQETNDSKAKDSSVITTIITATAGIIVALIGVWSIWLQRQPQENPIATSLPTEIFILPTDIKTDTPPTLTLEPNHSGVYFFDDFSSGTAKWWQARNLDNEYATEIRTIKDGVFRWEVSVKKGVVAQVFSETLPIVSDFELTMQLKQVNGDTDIPYGLIFRYNNNGYYRFAIKNNGGFAISKHIKGESTPQYVKNWSNTSLISLTDYNEIKVIAKSNKLQFFINGALVGDVVDDLFATGQITLYTAPPEQESITIEMKYFSLNLSQ